MEKLYLDNTYLFEIECRLLEVIPVTDSKHGTHKLLFDKTIFHPQGGGQPSDSGTICDLDSGMPLFNVIFAQLNHDVGDIDHFGSIVDEEKLFALASSSRLVRMSIDSERRLLNAKLHSAGHVIDAALTLLGYPSSVLKPTKGYHFADGPFVEFEVQSPHNLKDSDLGALPELMNGIIHDIISEGHVTKIECVEKACAVTICGSDLVGYPDEVRVVEVAASPCPCGGTHIASTSELVGLTVTKIKKKKAVIKVSYLIL